MDNPFAKRTAVKRKEQLERDKLALDVKKMQMDQEQHLQKMNLAQQKRDDQILKEVKQRAYYSGALLNAIKGALYIVDKPDSKVQTGSMGVLANLPVIGAPIRSPDTQELIRYLKIIYATDAKSIFPGRITNMDLQLMMDANPSIQNTKASLQQNLRAYRDILTTQNSVMLELMKGYKSGKMSADDVVNNMNDYNSNVTVLYQSPDNPGKGPSWKEYERIKAEGKLDEQPWHVVDPVQRMKLFEENISKAEGGQSPKQAQTKKAVNPNVPMQKYENTEVKNKVSMPAPAGLPKSPFVDDEGNWISKFQLPEDVNKGVF